MVYLLKQLAPDRWLVSGDDELESKELGFEVFISVKTIDGNGEGSRTLVGTLVQIDSDGSLEMVFRYSDDSNTNYSSSRSSASNLKADLQSAASIPLPPYIEPQNAMKVSTIWNPVQHF